MQNRQRFVQSLMKLPMTDSTDPAKTEQARAIAREIGITEAQARELIDLLGMHRPSLLREARLLKRRELGKGKFLA